MCSRRIHRIASTALVLVMTSARAYAGADWNQFRGPQRAGIAAETGLLRAWPEAGPRVLWRRPLGEGFSSISAREDLLYTLFADEESEYVAAFQVADGSEVWRQRIGRKFYDEWGNGPRATPTIDDGTVYAIGSLGMLYALDRRNGAVRWQNDLQKDFPVAAGLPRFATLMPPDPSIDPGEFGHASSPLVVDDLLIVYAGSSSGKALVAFDKGSGRTRWTALDNPGGYSSPITVSLADQRQIVAVLHDEVVGVTFEGVPLWRFQFGWSATQPIWVPPDRILVDAPVGGVGAILLEISKDESEWRVEEIWRNRLMRHTWTSPVIYNDNVYGFDNATLRCLSLTSGEVLWSHRGLGKGSLVVADGLLFALSDWGLLVIAEARPGGFTETGKFSVFPEERSWTIPTPYDRKLFLRNHKQMVALDLVGH